MMQLAADLGTGNVGLLLDAWHLYTSGDSLAVLDTLTAAAIVSVHINDAPAGIPVDELTDTVRCLPLETGVIDLVGFMRKLAGLGYTGPVTTEPFNQRINALAAVDPLAAASGRPAACTAEPNRKASHAHHRHQTLSHLDRQPQPARRQNRNRRRPLRPGRIRAQRP
jgi:sugar phosphate isomerase/epimerase